MHAHFSEATVARFFIRFALGASGLSRGKSLVHILDLEAKVVDPFAPAARRQHRHIDVAVGEIDRAMAVIAHWSAPRLGHAERRLVKLGGLFLVIYFCIVIGVGIFVLVLLNRFVGAHERIASALERIAQNPLSPPR